LLCESLYVIEVDFHVPIRNVYRVVELHEESDMVPLAAGKSERAAGERYTKVIVTYDVRLRAQIVWGRNIGICFACPVGSPHDSGTEAREASGLIATAAACWTLPTSQSRKLAALDPIEVLVEGNFIRKQHRLETAGIGRVPKIDKLGASGIVGETPRRVRDLKHRASRAVRARGRIIWKWVVNKCKVIATILDPAFAEGPRGQCGLCVTAASCCGREGQSSACGQTELCR